MRPTLKGRYSGLLQPSPVHTVDPTSSQFLLIGLRNSRPSLPPAAVNSAGAWKPLSPATSASAFSAAVGRSTLPLVTEARPIWRAGRKPELAESSAQRAGPVSQATQTRSPS